MKFLCKKDYKLKHYWKKSEKVFLKGEYYTCEQFSRPVSGPDYYNGVTEQLLEVITKDNRKIYFGFEKGRYEYYKDYFMTNIEIRKKKLEKIHNFSIFLIVTNFSVYRTFVLLKERLSRFYKIIKNF